jgi:hypothetical protein
VGRADQQTAPRLRVFCSYAHEDLEFCEALRRHLRGLEHNEVIEFWYDREIPVGERWADEIDKKLLNADLVIFLVSEYMMDSDYIMYREFKTALERHRQGVSILPLLVRPYNLRGTALQDIEAMPKNAAQKLEAVERWEFPVDAYALVSDKVLDYAESYRTKQKGNGHLQGNSTDRGHDVIDIPELNVDVLGRSDFLEQIELSFSENPSMPVVITGSQGLGKSSVAKEYIRRHRKNYRHVFALNAAEPKTTLATGLTKIATSLGLPINDQTATRLHVRRWLEDNDSWLMLLDNVIDPESVRKFLPPDSRGHVLMTSRSALTWKNIATEFRLPRLTPDVCAELLTAWSGDGDLDGAVTLSQLKNCLPVAIWQVAQEILTRGITIQDYLREVEGVAVS